MHNNKKETGYSEDDDATYGEISVQRDFLHCKSSFIVIHKNNNKGTNVMCEFIAYGTPFALWQKINESENIQKLNGSKSYIYETP